MLIVGEEESAYGRVWAASVCHGFSLPLRRRRPDAPAFTWWDGISHALVPQHHFSLRSFSGSYTGSAWIRGVRCAVSRVRSRIICGMGCKFRSEEHTSELQSLMRI